MVTKEPKRQENILKRTQLNKGERNRENRKLNKNTKKNLKIGRKQSKARVKNSNFIIKCRSKERKLKNIKNSLKKSSYSISVIKTCYC